MVKPLLAVLLTLVVGVLIAAFVLQPAEASVRYWVAVAWLVVLVFVNWFASAALFSGAGERISGAPGSLMGSLPAINVIIAVYSIISFPLLLTYNFDLIDLVWQVSLQVLLATLVAAIAITMVLAAKGAASGAAAAVSKTEILEECRRLERFGVSQALQKEIRDTLDYVAHKMPHPSKLSQERLEDFFQTLKTVDHSDEIVVREVLKKIRTL